MQAFGFTAADNCRIVYVCVCVCVCALALAQRERVSQPYYSGTKRTVSELSKLLLLMNLILYV